MKRAAAVVCVAVFALFASAASSAGLFRAYLSSTGSDTNDCTLPHPCRLLPAALAAVNDRGEIWMLDSANFNTTTVIVNKSVTILAIPGALGSLVAPTSADALQISVGLESVTLRNLTMRGLDSVTGVGIELVAAGALRTENCEIYGLGTGILVDGISKATIVDTTIHEALYGVRTAVAAEVAMERLNVSNSSIAVVADNGARVTVANSNLTQNALGLLAQATSVSGTVIDVARSTISSTKSGLGSGFSVLAESGLKAEIFVHSTTIHADTGFSFGNGGGTEQIFSYGDNRLVFYTAGVVNGSLTPISGI